MSLVARARFFFFRTMLGVERARLGLGAIVLVLAAVIALRNLLEIALVRNPSFPGLAAYVHYPLAYVGPFLSLSLVLAFWGRVAPLRVMRLMTLAWLLTLTPPLTDLVLHSAHEAPTIGYLEVDPADLGHVWLHFFNPFAHFSGTTPGIRIEAFAAVVLGFVYAAMRSRRVWRGIACALSVYVVSLMWFTMPSLVLVAVRLFDREAVRNDLLWGEGLLRRGVRGEAMADATATLWLVPLVLLLGLLWRFLERGERPRFTAFERASADLGGARWLGAIALASGLLSGLTLRYAGKQLLSGSPYDEMAALGALLALLLGLSATGHAWSRRGALAAGSGLLALALAFALGTSVSLGLATACFASSAWCVLPPGRPGWRTLGAAASLGGAGLGAFSAGYALVYGPEALARMPMDLSTAWLIAGASAGAARVLVERSRSLALIALALGLGVAVLMLRAPVLLLIALPAAAGAVLLARLAGRPRLVAAAAGTLLALLLAGVLAHPGLGERYREQASCVARLESLRGEEYLDKGRFGSAQARFKAALRCDENDVAAHRGLGLVALEKDKLEEALKHFELAAELAPRSAPAQSNLAAVLLRVERPEEALEAASRSLELDPVDLDARFNRALALESLGRVEEAIEEWRRYVEIGDSRVARRVPLQDARRRLRALEAGREFPATPEESAEAPR